MVEKSSVKVCVIGAGDMANAVHYPSLVSFNDVEIAGICDQNRERLRTTAEKFHIPQENRYDAQSYTDYQNMIEQVNPDGVYAIGPPHIMYDIWTWCLQQGVNLYIEKPIKNHENLKHFFHSGVSVNNRSWWLSDGQILKIVLDK